MRRQTVSRNHEKIKEIGESIQYFSPDKLEERNRVQSQPEGQFVLPVLLFRIETGTQFFVSAFVLESLKLVTSQCGAVRVVPGAAKLAYKCEFLNLF